MAPFQLKDRWLALGLIAVIYIGGRIISWQIRTAERIGIEEKGIRETAEAAEQSKKKDKEKGEDDIPLDSLEVLIRHPDWDIRHAACAILLNRFASDGYCEKALDDRFNQARKANDTTELNLMKHFIDWTNRDLEVDLRRGEPRRRPGYLHMSRSFSGNFSPTMGSDNGLVSRGGTSPSSTLLSDLGDIERARAAHARANGRPWPPTGRFTEELDEDDESSDHSSVSSSRQEGQSERNARREAEAEAAAETSTLFANLPFVPDEDDGWIVYGSSAATDRRRHHREAIVIGRDDDGIEIIQQPDSPVPGEIPHIRGGEGNELLDSNEAQAADELIQQVRGLEGQVQGLLDTLHQFEEEGGESS